MACLVNGEYKARSSWKDDDAYNGAGDGGLESRAFCSIAAILGSMASSSPPLLSPLLFLLFGGEQVTHPRLGEDLEHALIQQVGKAWAIHILSWRCQALQNGSRKNCR